MNTGYKRGGMLKHLKAICQFDSSRLAKALIAASTLGLDAPRGKMSSAGLGRLGYIIVSRTQSPLPMTGPSPIAGPKRPYTR